MSRKVKVAAAQIGAISVSETAADTLPRLITLLKQAASQSVQLVVFPEIALTTFFPRHLLTGDDLERFFHTDTPSNPVTNDPTIKPLFDLARTSKIDIVLGFAERDPSTGKGFNSSVYYSASADTIISKYRKIHLPGTIEPFEDPAAVNQLEKRYFTPGDLGFKAFRAPGLIKNALKKSHHSSESQPSTGPRIDARTKEAAPPPTAGKGDPILGMLICNDRRWPEAWRVLTLQGAEIVIFGYNTGAQMAHLWGSKPMTDEQAREEALFHSKLVQQANSYQNACFSISAARCGNDDGKYELIGGSAIVSPEGHVLAEAKGVEDELVVAEVDLGDCRQGKEKTFDYDRHRRVETYGLISSQTGVVEPELLE